MDLPLGHLQAATSAVEATEPDAALTGRTFAGPDTARPELSRGRPPWVVALLCAGSAAGFVALSQASFIAFHLVVEMAVMVVLLTMFSLAWRTARISTNGYLTLIGMAALPIAFVTAAHALLYKGMPVLPGHPPDVPTQLWLIARYLTAGALLVAPLFVARRLTRPGLAVSAFSLAGGAAVAAIALGLFPAAFTAASGLTAFKVASEYVIIGVFVVALALLWRRRGAVATDVFRLLVAAVATSIVAELLFTTYTDVYGITNMLGHLAYLLSFYLLYLALVDVSLRRPYDALFREVAASEAALREAHYFSEGLNEIDAAVHSTLDDETIFERVVSKAKAIIGADAAVLGLFEGDRFRPRYIVGYSGGELRHLSLDRDVGRHIFHSWELGAPVAVGDTREGSAVSPQFIKATGARAILVNVLTVRDEPIGALGFHWLGGPHVASAAEVDFSRKVTATLALALDNARSYASEREIAETLQASMASAVEVDPAVDIGHVYRPAPGLGRIGGDFYDVFRLTDGRLMFVLGDVSGRGLEMASINATVRSAIRALAVVDPDPRLVMSRANESITRQLRVGQFITAVLGVIDPATGDVAITIAGHPWPLVAGRPELTPAAGSQTLPLGVLAVSPSSAWRFRLAPGGTLMLYTDGASEARRDGHLFGEERVVAAVERAALRDSAQDVVAGVLDEVREFAGGDLNDDLALLAIRYLGARPETAPAFTPEGRDGVPAAGLERQVAGSPRD